MAADTSDPQPGSPPRSDLPSPGESPRTLAEQTTETGDPSRGESRAIGGYRIIRKLGEGGMGVVYEAEQQHPHRPVALKVVRGGRYVDEHHVKLFQREAEALARLKHPGIGAIYEAGRTDAGEHFFAMELVRGEPLHEYVRAKKPPVRERLKLFCRICEAINYAHQRGVMHRDLKPSNVLIDADGNPKILDFGLAKITDSDIAVTTVVTEIGRIQGTLPYMSPEQARGNPDEIDLRSDVYSLGVLLYELLTQQLPYDVRRAMLHDAVRVICEERPRRPSTISRTLRGDVETIALKALEKEPRRRYQSATALGEDVERYLADQPILARPPSAMYQFRKLVARHKAPFTFVAALFVLVAAFGVSMSVLYARAERLRVTAEDERAKAVAAEQQQNRERQRAEQAEAHVRAEADKTMRVQQFLQNMLASVGVNKTKAAELTVGEMLDEAVKEVRSEFANQDEIRADLLLTLGRAYYGMHLFDQADRTLGEALDIRRKVYGEESLGVAEVLLVLGDMLAQKYPRDDSDIDRAQECVQRALEIRETLLGQDHELVLEARLDEAGIVWLKDNLRFSLEPLEWMMPALIGTLRPDDFPAESAAMIGRMQELWEAGDHEQAVSVFRELMEQVIERTRKLWADGKHEAAREFLRQNYRPFLAHPILRKWMPNLLFGASVTKIRGSAAEVAPSEQEPFLREAIDLTREVHGDEHEWVAQYSLWLGQVLAAQGRVAEAEPFFREALLMNRKLHGDEHPDVAASFSGLVAVLQRQGKLSEAESLWREALDRQRKLHGDEHANVATSLSWLAYVIEKQGRLSEAEPLRREALGTYRKLYGDEDGSVVMGARGLAGVLMKQGKYSEAESLYRGALEMRRKLRGVEHAEVAASLGELAGVLLQQGKLSEAEPLYREALAMYRKLYGEKHSGVAMTLANLAYVLMEQGKLSEAEVLGREALAIQRRIMPEGHSEIGGSLASLGNCLLRQERFAEAEELLRECLAIREETLPESWLRFSAMSLLGEALAGQEKYEEAEDLLVEGYEGMKGKDDAPEERKGEALERIVECYDAWHAAEPGKGCDAKAAEWRAKLQRRQTTTRPTTTQRASEAAGEGNPARDR